MNNVNKGEIYSFAQYFNFDKILRFWFTNYNLITSQFD